MVYENPSITSFNGDVDFDPEVDTHLVIMVSNYGQLLKSEVFVTRALFVGVKFIFDNHTYVYLYSNSLYFIGSRPGQHVLFYPEIGLYICNAHWS